MKKLNEIFYKYKNLKIKPFLDYLKSSIYINILISIIFLIHYYIFFTLNIFFDIYLSNIITILSIQPLIYLTEKKTRIIDYILLSIIIFILYNINFLVYNIFDNTLLSIFLSTISHTILINYILYIIDIIKDLNNNIISDKQVRDYKIKQILKNIK